MQWLLRGLCGSLIVVAGAMAFTLMTHVPLPGLDRILSPRNDAGAEQPTHVGAAAGRSLLGVGLDVGSPKVTTTAAHLPAVATIARTGVTAVSSHLVATAPRGSTTPVAAATPTPAAGTPRPRAAAQGANSANPRSTVKSSNSSRRSTPSSTKSANPRSVAARAKAKPSGEPTVVAHGSKP